MWTRPGTLGRHQVASQALREWRAQVRSLALPCFDEDRVTYERAIRNAVERLRELNGFDALLRDYVARRRDPRGSGNLADGIVDGVAYWRRTREMIVERIAESAP